MTKARWILRFIIDQAGTAAVEFAFIVPVMLVLLAGVVEIGRAYQVYNAANRLASQYAITWADCSDIPTGSCNNELNYFNSVSTFANIAPQLIANQLNITMFQVAMVASQPTVIYASPPSATMTAAQISAAQAVIATGQEGVVVTATYSHALQFFQVLMNAALSNYLTASFTVAQLK